MTIEKRAEQAGVDVHLDPDECELLSRLASDADKASGGTETLATHADLGQSYFSLSLALGRKIRALAESEAALPGEASKARPLAHAMVDLILGDDPA